MSISTGGSGASMDNGSAVVTYAALPSGKVPVGLLLNDMVNIDLTRQHHQHKDEVQKGGKVTLAQKGTFVTNNLEGTSPSKEALLSLLIVETLVSLICQTTKGR